MASKPENSKAFMATLYFTALAGIVTGLLWVFGSESGETVKTLTNIGAAACAVGGVAMGITYLQSKQKN